MNTSLQVQSHKPESYPIDSILIQSFGGPEKKEDVIPFLKNVTVGKNVPEDRLEEVAKQYLLFNGVSPLNQHCRDLIASLKVELKEHEIGLPIYWGNRNWNPMLPDAIYEMEKDGRRNALVFTTSAFSSYSGCRQYRQDLENAIDITGSNIILDKLRLYYNHPDFIGTWIDNMGDLDANTKIIFTAHSIPVAMSEASNYLEQLHSAAQIICEEVRNDPNDYDLVFQSRSGPPHIPWLEPDINDHLKVLSKQAVNSVTVVPLGFTSDHMEVMFDLDTQARQTAQELGIGFTRVSSPGNNPRFIRMIRELIEEQLFNKEARFLGELGAWPEECPENHCLTPRQLAQLKKE